VERTYRNKIYRPRSIELTLRNRLQGGYELIAVHEENGRRTHPHCQLGTSAQGGAELHQPLQTR